jgi:hypothetical protein
MQVSVRNVADAFERDVSTCSIASEFFLRRFFLSLDESFAIWLS